MLTMACISMVLFQSAELLWDMNKTQFDKKLHTLIFKEMPKNTPSFYHKLICLFCLISSLFDAFSHIPGLRHQCSSKNFNMVVLGSTSAFAIICIGISVLMNLTFTESKFS